MIPHPKMDQTLIKSFGFIIKRRNTRDADRLLIIYTRDYGKLSVIAKGVRKVNSRRSSHLEIFRNAKLTIRRYKSFDYVSEVTTVKAYEQITGNLTKSTYAYYICELVDQLTQPAEPNPQIYSIVERNFDALITSDSKNQLDAVIYRAAREILQSIGYLPSSTALTHAQINRYIESLIEKPLKTPKFVHKL